MLLDSESPLLYINRSQHEPVVLEQFGDIFFPERETLAPDEPALGFLDEACQQLRDTCELQNSYEHLFLTLYFDHLRDILSSQHRKGKDRLAIDTLMRRLLIPLPQTHFYLTDFSVIGDQCIKKCVKVDFAFWTGRKFWVVLIDEPGHAKDRIQEERLLRSWAVEIVRLSEKDLCGSGFKDFLRRICQFPQMAGCL
jgi:hypothetical protein